MKKKFLICLTMAVVLLSVLVSVEPVFAQTSVCGQWDIVGLVNNTYIYQQNEWNSSERQCANAGPNAQFTITTANFSSGGGSPASYPSLYKGCHPFGGETPNQGICSVNSNMPIRVSNITGASTSVSASGSSSIYNFAYDLWFTTNGSVEGRPRGGTELMIWLNYAGSIQPFGSQAGTATIGGATYEVWTGDQDWHTISYRRQSRTNSASLDLKAFMNDAVSRGSLSSSSYLMDIEVGFEIWSGGSGLGISSFSASVSGSGGGGGPELTTAPTAPPAQTPVQAGSGVGLLGEYYDNMDLTTLKVTRIDPTLNFNWAGGSPDSSIDADTFSVRWTGQVQPRYTGDITFYVSADDGERLWVNNQQIINEWVDHETTEDSGTIALTAGQKYDLKLEYYENGGDADIVLSWSNPWQDTEIIPQSQLYSSETPAPTPVPIDTPAPTAQSTPPPSFEPGNGDGLLGEYYSDTNLSNLVLSRIDPVIDMNWGGGSPDSSVPEDQFSVRWTGKIEARMTETYTIITRTDDGTRVWINNQQVIDDWNDHTASEDTEASGTINMEMGVRYDIRIEYYENGGDASAQVYWSNPYLEREIIPQSQLYSGAAPPAGNPGDVNEDGDIDIVDALLVAQYYVGLDSDNFNVANADTNCNGSVDIVDALLIAQYYVGLINQFC
jgi:hypothetical protein